MRVGVDRELIRRVAGCGMSHFADLHGVFKPSVNGGRGLRHDGAAEHAWALTGGALKKDLWNGSSGFTGVGLSSQFGLARGGRNE